jgi:hypothetical protein
MSEAYRSFAKRGRIRSEAYMQQERAKLESRTVARTRKDKVRAGIIARHESKSQKSKNCC